MASPDLFDAYFRLADTDRDGRISGQEAVSFFQGANLHREVLAKIWQYADQGQTGYLSRAEFYNALKLVTVAQTGRDLTPAIVTRALNGPAASQIPAPQIQVTPGPGPGPAPIGSQSLGGARPVGPMGPAVPVYQQYSAVNIPPGSRTFTPTSLPKASNLPAPVRPTNISGDRLTNKSSSWSGPGSNDHLNDQISHAPLASSPQDGFQGSLSAGANAGTLKTPSSAEPDLFGGDIFTAVPTKPAAVPTQTQLNSPVSQMPRPSPTTNQAPQPRVIQTSGQPDGPFALVPSSFTPPPTSRMLQPVATPANQQDQEIPAAASGTDGTKTWPKMTDAIVRRYTKIFFEVDTDKDGKISGVQARDLFLSWRLPREVLKQIWDLSDQDRDSMLSLREFCMALYLMERHREGRALPATISAPFYFDESGVQALRISEAQVAVAQNSAGYNLPAWQQNPSVIQATGPGVQPRSVQGVVLPGQAPVRGSMPAAGRDGYVPAQMVPPKSNAPVMEMKSVNQLAAADQLTLQTRHQNAVNSEKKVYELEKQIMDSKEKMEFYRSKMQDIVLFKTRCDNRLAEITERAAADKREVESLAKRYDEKYKQAGESQSRLLADEAAFHDVQERRLELHNALVMMEHGGDTNAFLQARADRLQNDLDGLKKALNAKCKQLSLRVKPISLLELPFGWQPGIQENAAQWDESWDNFKDEGFAYIQEFMEEGSAGSEADKPKNIASWDESGQLEDGHESFVTNGEVKAEEVVSEKDQGISSSENDDAVGKGGHRDMSSSSPQVSGSEVSSTTNIIRRSSPKHDHEPSSSTSVLESNGDWGSAFNHKSDDTESNASWGWSDGPSAKVSEDTGFQAAKFSAFGLNDPFDTLSNRGQSKDDLPSFGPIRTKERQSVFFDNSVPSTPLHSNISPGPISSKSFFDESIPSTPLYNNHTRVSGSSSDQFVRFDSFSSNNTDLVGNSSDSFARFDSFNHVGSGSRGFSSFDDSDPFVSTGPFGGGQAPRSGKDAWSAFS